MLRMEATPHTSVTNTTGAFDSLLALSGSLLILAWHEATSCVPLLSRLATHISTSPNRRVLVRPD
jgi:hypothetical protein